MSCIASNDHEAYDFLESPGAIITVLVGVEETPFAIHEQILKAKSDYFRAALSGPWKEAEQRSFRFEDVRPEDFAVYVYWLYYHQIKVPDLASTAPAAMMTSDYIDSCLATVASNYPDPSKQDSWVEVYWTTTPSDRNWTYLFMLYALGDRLQSDPFKNSIMDQTLVRLAAVQGLVNAEEKCRRGLEIPLSIAIRHCYEITPPKSALRRFLTNITAEVACPAFMETLFSSAQHLDFIIDLGRKLTSNGNVLRGTKKHSANWHLATHALPRQQVCAVYHEHPKAKSIASGTEHHNNSIADLDVWSSIPQRGSKRKAEDGD